MTNQSRSKGRDAEVPRASCRTIGREAHDDTTPKDGARRVQEGVDHGQQGEGVKGTIPQEARPLILKDDLSQGPRRRAARTPTNQGINPAEESSPPGYTQCYSYSSQTRDCREPRRCTQGSIPQHRRVMDKRLDQKDSKSMCSNIVLFKRIKWYVHVRILVVSGTPPTQVIKVLNW